ncbi:GNAT family N-acetyltransferase [Dactylosporangium sp. NPDC000521]|uniref:GNAT family N-acetyltransferase n=1 Tax=Dactylosporangium sp. NPDC000521 TaxID=3363975 RepID=UPI003686D559
MSSPLTVRPARVEDVAQMARVIVRCWRETYRGLMLDTVLDDPGLVPARERFWTAALTDERYRANRVAVAERDGSLIGVAMSGPPLDPAAAWTRQLYVLYVHAEDHGTGAGTALLEAVLDPGGSAALWVADPNPRAQAFYRRHGFVADGTAQDDEDGVREVRMVRRRHRHSDLGVFEGSAFEWRAMTPSRLGGTDEVALCLTPIGGVDDDQGPLFDTAADVVRRLDPHALRRAVAEACLELYNDTWRQDDVELDEAAFTARITPTAVDITEEDLTVHLDDGGLFGQHSIVVSLDLDLTVTDVKLAG